MKPVQKPKRGDAAAIVDAVKATKLPFLKLHFSQHGTLRLEVRRGSMTVPLRCKPLSPEWYVEYGKAVGEISAKVQLDLSPRSDELAWLIDEYMKTGGFKALAYSTQQVRRRVLKQIADEFGSLKFATLDRFDIERIRAPKVNAGKPEAARHRVKFLRQVFAYGQSVGLMRHDPLIGLQRDGDNAGLRTRVHKDSDGTWRGHWTWTRDQVADFFEHWHPGTRPHLAMSLMLYLGVRISDVQQLGPRHERKGRLVFTTAKRVGRARAGVEMNLPIVPALQDAIDAARKNKIVSVDHYILTERGEPFSQKAISAWFSERCRMAGLPPKCTAHGVRKALARILAEEGASSSELKATFGWTTSKLADLYTEAASRADLSDAGLERIQKIGVSPGAPKLSHLRTETAEKGQSGR